MPSATRPAAARTPSNPMAAKSSKRPGKRIVCCMDGTWMNSDGSQQEPSNVTLISYCIKQRSKDGIQQVVYYHSGVGSTAFALDHFVAGATGAGISENIREAYGFICQNYESGDEIFLIGFSRGAFTARSIASLIAQIGLLTRQGLGYFYEIFDDWENQSDQRYRSKDTDNPFPNRPPVTSPAYVQQLQELNLTRPDIPIRACAVWETVGALGIPKVADIPTPVSHKYSFVNADIPPNIEYAFHAIALDEERRAFQATMWSRPPDQQLPKLLKQCWFPGVHNSVGGGEKRPDLSIISLNWMIAQLNPILDFDRDWIMQQNKASLDLGGVQSKPWGSGTINNTFEGIYLVAGSVSRTPGRYCQVDPETLEPTNIPLVNTFECVHASVRARLELQGSGYDGKGAYDSKALKHWTISTGSGQQPANSDLRSGPYGSSEPDQFSQQTGDNSQDQTDPRNDQSQQNASGPPVMWSYTGDPSAPISTKSMPEDILVGVELGLLSLYPQVQAALERNAPLPALSANLAKAMRAGRGMAGVGKVVGGVEKGAGAVTDDVKNGLKEGAGAITADLEEGGDWV